MTRPLHHLRNHARRAVRAVVIFFGPVADSVRKDLNQEERRRIAIKAVATLCTTGGAIHSLAKDPSIYTELVAPVAMAAAVGALDAMRRYNHGTDPVPPGTPPDGPLPPASGVTA